MWGTEQSKEQELIWGKWYLREVTADTALEILLINSSWNKFSPGWQLPLEMFTFAFAFWYILEKETAERLIPLSQEEGSQLVFQLLLVGFPQSLLVTQVIFCSTQVTLWLGSDVNLRSVFKTELFVVHSLLPPRWPEPDTSASLCVHCCSLIMYKEKFHWMKKRILKRIVISQVGFSYHSFFRMSWAWVLWFFGFFF